MLHSDFLTSAVKYEQLSGCSFLVACFSMHISRKACSTKIVEMWPCLTSRYHLASAGTPSDMHVTCYKNRAKIGELAQLPCNLVNSPFLLAASSLAPRSSSLNHGSREASKGGDDGVGPGHDQAGSPCREPRGGVAAVMPLCCGQPIGRRPRLKL